MIWNVIALTALILSTVGVALGAIALIIAIALKNSSHKLTFIDPSKQNFDDFGKEVRESLAKSDDTLDTL